MAHGTIVINEARCKGCELCTTVCPYDLIHMAAHFNNRGYRPAQLADPNSHCTGCTLCATICPEAAITVYREAKPTGVLHLTIRTAETSPVLA
ncbi:MAG TPA: 4Fe-4S dicluster domain-containing protein [Anaerolineae bacterium]|nr:4Fe-4S dicluster domain-containing protein [Anaerolineae bacterium]